MTHKYERQCWSCGSRDMEKFPDHVRCRSCGATWNEIPDPVSLPMTVIANETRRAPGARRFSHARPSGTVQRQAARARDAKRQARTPE